MKIQLYRLIEVCDAIRYQAQQSTLAIRSAAVDQSISSIEVGYFLLFILPIRLHSAFGWNCLLIFR